MFNNTVAGYDRIWNVAQNVWTGLTSSMAERAFVLAFRVMHKIIEEDCNNQWLCHGTPHCFVRRDFVNTYDEIVPYQTGTTSTTVTVNGTQLEF